MTHGTELSEDGYDALRAIITLGKGGARSLDDLRLAARNRGLKEEHVEEAIAFWREDLKRRHPDPESLALAYS